MDFRKYKLSELTRDSIALTPKKGKRALKLSSLSDSEIRQLIEAIVMGGYICPSIITERLTPKDKEIQ